MILYSPFVLALAIDRRVSWIALPAGLLAGGVVVAIEALVIQHQVAGWSTDQTLSLRLSMRVSMVVFTTVAIVLTTALGPLVGFGLVTIYVLWCLRPRQRWIERRIRARRRSVG